MASNNKTKTNLVFFLIFLVRFVIIFTLLTARTIFTVESMFFIHISHISFLKDSSLIIVLVTEKHDGIYNYNLVGLMFEM